MVINQLDMFDEPEPTPLVKELDFDLTLKDGNKVSVHFDREICGYPHFEFSGEAISETGYRSQFSNYALVSETEQEIISMAAEFAERLRREHLAFMSKEAKRKKKAGGGVK